jgi:hypothetical protein
MRSVFALSLLICALVTCSPTSRHEDIEAETPLAWSVRQIEAPDLIRGRIVTNLGRVDIYIRYPWWRVVLCDEGMSWKEGVPYESVYQCAPSFDSRVAPYPQRAGIREEVAELQNSRLASKGRGRELFGYREGEVFYSFRSDELSVGELKRFIRGFFEDTDTLGRGVLPRVSVEQLVEHEWIRLTQMSQGEFLFQLAPADTFRLKMLFGLMDVVFLEDHVEVRPVVLTKATEWKLGFRPGPFGWDSEVARALEGRTGRVGSAFEFVYTSQFLSPSIEIYIMGPGIQYTDEVRSQPKGPCSRQGIPTHLSLFCPGPPLYHILENERVRNRTFRRWPLVPTVRGLRRGERVELGYPGDGDLPDSMWARLRNLPAWNPSWEEKRARYQEHVRSRGVGP